MRQQQGLTSSTVPQEDVRVIGMNPLGLEALEQSIVRGQ